MALPLVEPPALATLRAEAAALPSSAEGHNFASAVLSAVESIHQELSDIHSRNEAAHTSIMAAQVEATERHNLLRQQHDGLQDPLARLQQYVGGVAVDEGVVATTLAARVVALEQTANETVISMLQRISALEAANAVTAPMLELTAAASPSAPAQEFAQAAQRLGVEFAVVREAVNAFAQQYGADRAADAARASALEARLEARLAQAEAVVQSVSIGAGGNTKVSISCSRAYSQVQTFSGKSQNFRRWAQSFEDVCAQVWGPDARAKLQWAKAAGNKSLPESADEGENLAFSQDVWAALGFKLDETPWSFTLTMRAGRGLELWRVLQHEYDPVVPEHAMVLEQQLMQVKPIKDRKEVSGLLQVLDSIRMRHARTAPADKQLSHDKLHTALMRAIPKEFVTQALINSTDISSYTSLRKEF